MGVSAVFVRMSVAVEPQRRGGDSTARFAGTLRPAPARGRADAIFLSDFLLRRPLFLLRGKLFLQERGGSFVVEHPALVPLQKLPHSFGGPPPKLQLQKQGADEREVELDAHSARTFGDPMPATQQALYPASRAQRSPT